MKDWLPIVVSVLVLIFGGGCFWKIREHIKKWSNLRKVIKKQKYLIESSGDFFGGLLYCDNIKSFNKNLPLYEKSDKDDKTLSIPKLTLILKEYLFCSEL